MGNLIQHQHTIHDGKKKSCRECDHQAVSLNTIRRYMKTRSAHAVNVTTMQLKRVISLNTGKLYTNERSTHVRNVTTMQLKREVSLNTIELSMKERSI